MRTLTRCPTVVVHTIEPFRGEAAARASSFPKVLHYSVIEEKEVHHETTSRTKPGSRRSLRQGCC